MLRPGDHWLRLGRRDGGRPESEDLPAADPSASLLAEGEPVHQLATETARPAIRPSRASLARRARRARGRRLVRRGDLARDPRGERRARAPPRDGGALRPRRRLDRAAAPDREGARARRHARRPGRGLARALPSAPGRAADDGARDRLRRGARPRARARRSARSARSSPTSSLGQGLWTPWQMLGWALCGAVGRAPASARPPPLRLRDPRRAARARLRRGAEPPGDARPAPAAGRPARPGVRRLVRTGALLRRHARRHDRTVALAAGPGSCACSTASRASSRPRWCGSEAPRVRAAPLSRRCCRSRRRCDAVDGERRVPPHARASRRRLRRAGAPVDAGALRLGGARARRRGTHAGREGPRLPPRTVGGSAADLDLRALALAAAGEDASAAPRPDRRRREGGRDDRRLRELDRLGRPRAPRRRPRDSRRDRPAPARRAIRDGGWSWSGKGPGDADDTAAVVEALRAAGQPAASKPIQRALAFLRRCHAQSGGFAASPAGRRTRRRARGRSRPSRPRAPPREARARLPRPAPPANGSYRYAPTLAVTPVWVTSEVVPALLRKPFPLVPLH